MSDEPPRRDRREWDERFMKALAKLEADKRVQERCGGCGRPFGDHPTNDFSECVRKILSQD